MQYTVVPRTNQANPVFSTKIRSLNSSYQILNMLPNPSLHKSNLPLMRAFKQGISWPCTSEGIRNTTGQSEKFYILLNIIFNFDQLYFWCPLRYRVIQYLVWKLSLIVKLNSESLGMATFLDSVTCYSKPYFSTKIEFAWFVLGTIVVSAYFFSYLCS